MKQKLTSPGVARFTKALLDILFYAGIAVTVSLPWTMRWAARFYPSFAARLTLHTALFLLAGVCAVLILFELRRMLKTVVSGDCFVRQNVSSLCRMAYYAFAIALHAGDARYRVRVSAGGSLLARACAGVRPRREL